ncbi:MAG TPA: ABC transporter permease, partial [Cyanophyceae cyanobacterium]
TTIAQLMLLLKTNKRSLWAAGTVTALNLLPPMALGMLGLGGDPEKYATLWLFSTFPWIGLEHAATITIIKALLGEFLLLTVLNLQLTRQLRRAGESASKALFAGRPSLPN